MGSLVILDPRLPGAGFADAAGPEAPAGWHTGLRGNSLRFWGPGGGSKRLDTGRNSDNVVQCTWDPVVPGTWPVAGREALDVYTGKARPGEVACRQASIFVR